MRSDSTHFQPAGSVAGFSREITVTAQPAFAELVGVREVVLGRDRVDDRDIAGRAGSAQVLQLGDVRRDADPAGDEQQLRVVVRQQEVAADRRAGDLRAGLEREQRLLEAARLLRQADAELHRGAVARGRGDAEYPAPAAGVRLAVREGELHELPGGELHRGGGLELELPAARRELPLADVREPDAAALSRED